MLALFLRGSLRAPLAFLAGILLGLVRVSPLIAEQTLAKQFVGQTSEITGTIASDPKPLEKETSLTLEQLSLHYTTDKGKSQVLPQPNSQIYVKLSGADWDLARSDKIRLRGKALNGFGSYNLYFWHPTVLAVSKPDPPDFALQIRQYLSRNIQDTVQSPEASSLALGFLLGEKTAMPDEFIALLRQAGLAHVVVASGFALSILVNFAKKYLSWISRAITLIGAIWLVFAFIAITGFSPSLLRAGIATLLALLAWYVGRRFHPLRLLAYVCAISIALSPMKFFSVAWQLSFASYAGILLLYPLLAKYFFGEKSPSYFATIILVSLSAQLACLPLNFYYFGSFALCGLVANLLVTPFIPLVMLLAFGVGLGASSPILVWPLKTLLSFQTTVIKKLGGLPWALIQGDSGNPAFLLLYLPLILMIVGLKLRVKHDFRPRYAVDKSSDYGKIFAC